MTRAYGTPVRLDDLEEATVLAQQRLAGDGDEVGVLFRVEAVRYAAVSYPAYCDGHGEWYTTDPRLEVHAYWVNNWTEHGATLRHTEPRSFRPKWVDLRPGAKQWASRDVAEAVRQFAERRRRQIYVLERQLARAMRELALTQPWVIPIPFPLAR
jgi:hypothetical protein